MQGLELALSVAFPGFRCELELVAAARGVTALFGRSGSGKSTCLRLLAGLERGQGRLHVFGECWQDDSRGLYLPTHRRGVGYVFQEPSLFPHLSVRDNLRYAERRRSAGRPALLELASAVEMLGVGSLLERSPVTLSGGERQRVAIARALLAAPRLLLMDEPLAALDDESKAQLLPHIEALRDRIGIPILYVSHSLEEVARLADHVNVLEGGRVVAAGPLVQMLGRLDLSLSRAPDAATVIEAVVTQHDSEAALTRVEFGGDGLWVMGTERAVGRRVRARVLARDVSIATERPGPSSILNVLPATVIEVVDDGPSVNVRLSLAASGVVLLARITRRSREALELRAGRTVFAQVKGVALFT